MNLRFWRNVTIITAAHVAAIIGFTRWNHKAAPLNPAIVWMSGSPEANAAAGPSAPLPTPRAPTRANEDDDEPDATEPLLASAKSEIQLPVATPTATPKPAATSTPAPSPSPKVKVTPKPRPRPTPTISPKPKPKPSPKKFVVAAKATPRPRSTPEEPEEKKDTHPEPTATPSPEKSAGASTTQAAGHSEKSSGPAGNARGHGGGATIQSQFGWYGSMLHDRFYSEWAQPGSLGANARVSALVKLRIEKDGRISSFEIVRSSGNATVDESINAVAKRVTKVDPLPSGLGNGDHYDVKINFELNSD